MKMAFVCHKVKEVIDALVISVAADPAGVGRILSASTGVGGFQRGEDGVAFCDIGNDIPGCCYLTGQEGGDTESEGGEKHFHGLTEENGSLEIQEDLCETADGERLRTHKTGQNKAGYFLDFILGLLRTSLLDRSDSPIRRYQTRLSSASHAVVVYCSILSKEHRLRT